MRPASLVAFLLGAALAAGETSRLPPEPPDDPYAATPAAPADTLPASLPAPAPADSAASADSASRAAAPTDSLARDSLASADAARPAAPLPAEAVSEIDSGGLELDEKTVKGKTTGTHRQKEVSRIRLGREQLQKVAAAQGDPFKVLGTLPGVSNQNDMSVRPFVRGGKAEETQVLWEGIPLLQPYHFASIYSIFNMEALEDMTLYSGGFPATVGNALSGAILMRARPAPLDSFRLYVDLSILRGLSHAGVPLVKDKLGVSWSFQSFWYDYAIDRGWDFIDFLADDSAFTAQKEKYRQYLDLPNFRDNQFGLNWRPVEGVEAAYTGILSRDVFTVRDAKDRLYVNGREVSPYFYERTRLFPNGTERRERKKSWDSLAIVSVDNGVHAVQLAWTPKDRWKVDQAVAWQGQDWHVSFFDQEVWTDTVTPDGRFAGFRRPGPSALLFKLGNRTLDYRLDTRYSGEDHILDFGYSQSVRSADYHTQLPKPVYDIIVHGSVDALDGLGFFNAGGFSITTADPLTNPDVEYLDITDLIRFDFEGEQSGTFFGAYVSDAWHLDPRHCLTLGLRAEADSYGKSLFLSPRIAWFQALGERDELTLASGLYSQSDFPFYLRAVNPRLRSEKSFHANAEWTHAFSRNYKLEFQLYQKNYYDLVTPSLVNTGRLDWDSPLLDGFDSTDFAALSEEQKKIVIDKFGVRKLDYRNGGLGKAAGGEISFFYDPNRVWSGWVSAEAGYSKRMDHPGERNYDFRQSRPWAFNWVNYFHMPSNYELSLRGRFSAGLPYTDFKSRGGVPGLGGGEVGDGGGAAGADTLLWVGPRNAERYSPYVRWDLRLSKEFSIRRHPLQSYFEIWNSFNTPNFIMADERTKNWKFVDLNYPIPILFLGLNYRW